MTESMKHGMAERACLTATERLPGLSGFLRTGAGFRARLNDQLLLVRFPEFKSWTLESESAQREVRDSSRPTQCYGTTATPYT